MNACLNLIYVPDPIMIPPDTSAGVVAGSEGGVLSFRNWTGLLAPAVRGAASGLAASHPATTSTDADNMNVNRRIWDLRGAQCERQWAPKSRRSPVHLQHIDSLK